MNVLAFLAVGFFASPFACARDIPRDHPRESSYKIVFQEYNRFSVIKDRSRGQDEIIADVNKQGGSPVSMIDAVVELGVHTPADKVPWKMLLERADVERESPAMVAWLVITAGKYLCSSDESYELEDWLFNQLRGGRHISPSIMVLGVSRISKHNTLREWSRLLRCRDSSAETCQTILRYASLWGVVHEGGVYDEGVNCILAGYDEDHALPERKIMIWESLFGVLDAASTRDDISDRSLWAIRQLAIREFANEKNDEIVRKLSTAAFRRGNEISDEVVAAARKIVINKTGSAEFQRIAAEMLLTTGDGR
ncbi:hypothetical protein [Planctopirus hydrillae]|uniref:hypothetical protein n=1 Tax=Planctopirus hydrillae TaxID=1841610 RepID=UPI00104239A9|nr:hypothetical protein [Planctopirus hydrillae]